jgi:hypothetical protein
MTSGVLRPIGHCVLTTAGLLARRSVRLPTANVGLRVGFADGTTGRVYRETVLTGAATDRPCVLVVGFRLRLVHGAGHAVFRWESLANTPLFVGFPGFVSKLWLAHDDREVYRGIYQWNGVDEAEEYVRCLRRILEAVSAPSSVRHVVVPDAIRDDVVPARSCPQDTGDNSGWWRPVHREPAG